MNRRNGRVAAVTGGTQGLGAGFSARFAGAGAAALSPRQRGAGRSPSSPPSMPDDGRRGDPVRPVRPERRPERGAGVGGADGAVSRRRLSRRALPEA